MAWYDKMPFPGSDPTTTLSATMINRSLLPLFLLCTLALPAGAADTHFMTFGDSITIGHGDGGIRCPDDIDPTGGYPPRLSPQLAARGIDAVFSNHGACGERTGAGVTRIDSVLNGGGDVIIIMEGTNDVSGLVGFETTVFNLNVMAQKAEAAGVVPVLASLVPRGPESGTDENNGKTFTIGEELRTDALQNGWSFADPFAEIFYRPSFFELYYTDQLHPNSTGYSLVANSMVDAAEEAATSDDLCAQVPPGPCTTSDTVMCLNQGRFRLQAVWKNFFGDEGVGHALPQTAASGAFFWVDPQHTEMMIKVLDGRANNNHFWVFYGALSNLEFTLIVTDTDTGECKEYLNPLGTFASVGDTFAFFDPLP